MRTERGPYFDMKILEGRTEVWRRTGPDYAQARIAGAPYMLSIDDHQGNRQGHAHDTSGHDFPMTRAELAALRAQITAILADG